MTGIQRLLKRVLPTGWAASMEAESRSWIVQCDTCQRGRSVWDLGGVRWKAAGTRRLLSYCDVCGKNTRHTMVRGPV
jgi:hypothetical protein